MKDSTDTEVSSDVTFGIVPKVGLDQYGHITKYQDFTPREKSGTLSITAGSTVTPVEITLPINSQFDEAHCEDSDGNEVLCDIKVVRANTTTAGKVTFSANNKVDATLTCYVTYFGIE